MAVAPDLWWLALGRIIAGITSSSFTTVYAYMADITAPEKRARAYGLIGAAFSAGFVLGPILGGLLGEFGPRVPFWFAAALSAVAFFYGLLVLPESLPVEKRMAFSWKRANPVGALILLKRHTELAGLAVVNFLLYFAHHLFSAVFVLYAAYRYSWGPREVGLLLALVGVLDMLVQGVLVGPVVKRLGDRMTMVLGLVGGTVGIAAMGWAPDGLMFILAMLPNALWGLAMPTLQSLMTRRVGEDEQGQLQGANMSVASIAGVMSPLFFGWVYSFSVGDGAIGTRLWIAETLAFASGGVQRAAVRVLTDPGLAFYLAAVALLLAALIGWWVGRQAERQESAAAGPAPMP
jgi:DHA1 family tetracycline resistance protein-like MFS transporter